MRARGKVVAGLTLLTAALTVALAALAWHWSAAWVTATIVLMVAVVVDVLILLIVVTRGRRRWQYFAAAHSGQTILRDEIFTRADRSPDQAARGPATYLGRSLGYYPAPWPVFTTAPPSPSPGPVVEDDTPRVLVAELPSHAALRTDISLIVRITTSVPNDRSRVAARLAGLTVTAEGPPVTVVVHPSRGLGSDEALEQVIRVFPWRDPDPVRFSLRAEAEGLQRVRVTAWAGGTFLCELILEVSIAQGGVTTETRPRVAELGRIHAEPGEVTLQISSEGGRYGFQLISDAYLGRIVHAEALMADPGPAVERAIGTLRSLAKGGTTFSPANARRWMEEVGVGLWSEMVPEAVKEEFWRLRGDIGAFSIAADDGVPWELLYPKAPGRDEGFLVEQFGVLRRAHGQGRSKRLSLADPRFVVSSRTPQNAAEEIDTIRRIIGDGMVVDDLGVLLEVIDSGELGLVHFACHNDFDPAAGSVIEMGGVRFEPGLLSSAVAQRILERRRPLVFVNACRTAGAIPEYTRLAGWAQKFMAAGAGAFAGTLWAVRSESARRFAEVFYQALAIGKPLGEAALAARTVVRRDVADPTWLAYSIYGDPTATFAGLEECP